MTSGIEISQEGIDLSQAQDSQKVLDSRFRYYDIAQESMVTLPTLANNGSTQIIYSHNMGFLPAFDVFDTVLQSYISVSSTLLGGSGLLSSTSQIYFKGFYNDAGWSGHKVLIRVYNVPITDTFVAPIEQTLPSKTSTNTQEGIKIVRGTSDIHDQELSKFALNSTGKSMSIQRTGTGFSNSGTSFHLVIEHDLGHPPTFLLASMDTAGQWVGAVDPSTTLGLATADGVNLTFRGVQSALVGTFAYIIFKDLGDFAI